MRLSLSGPSPHLCASVSAALPAMQQRRPVPRPLRRILAKPGRGSSPITGERAAGRRSRARATARRSCALARAAGARPCPCSRCRRAWRGACATRGAWSTTSRPPLWPAWQRWVRGRARDWAAEQETQVSLRTPSPSAWQRRSLGRAAQQAMQILLRMWRRAALTVGSLPRALLLSAGVQPAGLGSRDAGGRDARVMCTRWLGGGARRPHRHACSRIGVDINRTLPCTLPYP